ncbi:CynX/NimT family MFS transporter [Ralstonia solanacearum]|uniref:CynX/NimT family MFS transporter n=1 Tax=Ralstonia solanacearum TaxID=305 RepID=UPI0005C4E5D8|nr:CynX/NimT family MFS transporter [Ralstonia solanacearum]MBB6592902.1 CynX/NimT family MFS transporter [Ralstonia solanacearum]MBB6597129.1 CynX/NimT family MFS transporter [Ralstonia solanacearum]MDB0542055.1 CynX/NimT family MFS transporter [Ralstonia solanacearum]MDB0552370.1 CynX/NimT family MFS transporter [Ralstonia solanacearum]MDB0556956.1 CynX/NimT family MFS transporter [Ralstonia solanacearum]
MSRQPQPAAAPVNDTAAHRSTGALVMLVAGLVLVGVNLRPALSSLSPVLKQVAAGTGLSGATAGLLTTLPVVCLGVFAPAAAVLARRFGAERAVGGLLIALAAGIALRSAGGIVPLFAGTLAAGACIGVTGILLPGIIKRDFGRQADLMTGVYTMALCLGAAVAAGASALLSALLGGWQPALAFWALPALLAFAGWWPHMRHPHPAGAAARIERVALWRRPIAWQVTLYMGLQSSLAYCVFGWMPVILQDRGLSAVQSGMVVAVSVLVQLITALGGPFIARLGRDQRPTVLLMMLMTWAGLMGCLYAPVSTLWWWAVLLGLGQGGNFSVALSLIVLRSADVRVAASLSAMTQGGGYTLAAAGPYLMGVLHDLTGGWAVMGWLFSAIALGAVASGLLAGRDRTLHAGA